ncbi:glycosyltransferase [Rhodoferax sp. OV413]|uniref:glycosyltransferase n=1 Tax=Rhodoferax sp. OV413 TaxID=1855285 RepID=UPI000B84D571|nr:glycosyltransferase [Rhodoferax sp. OV413]
MGLSTMQDAQVFKERCEDSPGVLVLCQGDWRPTEERVRLFEEQNYYVLTAANGYQDIVDWLPQPRCIGAMFAHPVTVAQARQLYPDKVIERFEGVGARFLRTLTQELPYGLHNAGLPFTSTTPPSLKTVDVVSVFSPVALKRGQLLVESLLAANVTAYLFAQSLGSSPELLASFFDVVQKAGKQIEYFHYPFDPYALVRIDGRIVIDGRPIGANNSVVSAYLARARLLVHTSTTEGISNSVMEALLNDVPVLVCDDIRGPLQDLSLQLPECISRSAPETEALALHIQALLATARVPGAVRETFRQVIDPFEINRSMVRGVQEWFARNGLPWKGHCLGLLGGVQSKIDLATSTAEESYRGHRHIYPSPAEAVQCAAFQMQIAQALGQTAHVASLRAEMDYIQAGLAAPAVESAVAPNQALHTLLATLAQSPSLRHVLVVGAATSPHMDTLIAQLGHNTHSPQLHCVENSLARLEAMVQRYAEQGFVHGYHASSVEREAFPSEADVRQFYATTPGKLQDYPLDHVLDWLRQDVAEMESGGLTPNAIPSILAQLGVGQFDMTVINGREFTGFAELQQLYGCETIILECTQTYKNQRSLAYLSQDPVYQLLFTEPDIANGLAIFTKR